MTKVNKGFMRGLESQDPPSEEEPKTVRKDWSDASDEEAEKAVKEGEATDAQVPGKLRRMKVNKFTARIPNYTWNAYPDAEKAKWEDAEITSATVDDNQETGEQE